MRESRKRSIVLIVVGIIIVAITVPYLTLAQEGTPSPQAVSSPLAAEGDLIMTGEQIFTSLCVTCHQAGGKGFEDVYPALAGNPLVTLDDPEYVTRTVLYGRGGMPRFNSTFDDEQIAGVVSYIRTSLEGNDADPITPEFVASVRESVEAPEATPDVADPGQIDSPNDESTPESD